MTTPTRSARVAVTLLAALALTLTGCASDADPGAEPPGSTSSAQSAAGGPLAFAGTTVAGASLDARTLSARPTVLWFWAPF